ncbi:peptidoglycan binding domain-containing protein, partial [Blautia schinkii]|uniref:peptidoglycan binding domain-containing protein n=1 Tax=Blautia schinkii TaxID=180164 RepID=UPI0023B1E804
LYGCGRQCQKFTAGFCDQRGRIPICRLSYDESLFEQKTASLKCMQDNVEPVDAYIKELDDGFEVVPEIEGTKIDRDKLMEDIKNAVTTGRTVANLEEDGFM